MTKDGVHQLIQSLTGNEKRFFKLFATAQREEKNYVRLFSAMEKMKTYDDRKLKQLLKGERFLKNLSFEKNYLQKQILKALRVFHSENKVELQLNALLSDVKILAEKELFELCEKQIEKGIALAVKHEQHTHLLQLLIRKWDLESSLVHSNAQESLKNKLNTNDEIRLTLKSIETYLNYMLLHEKVVSRMRKKVRVRNTDDKKTLDKIMRHPLLANKPAADLGANARYMFHTAHYLNCFSRGNTQKAYRHVKAEMVLMETKPEAIYLTPRLFYNTTHNYLYGCLFTKRYDEMKLFMRNYREGFYKKLPIDFSMIEDVMEESLLNYTLALSIHSKDYALGLKTISDYEKKITEYEKIINEEMRIAIYYKMSRILLLSGNPKKALKWTNKLLNESNPDVRPDMQCYARILNLIIHFELTNFDLLESIVGSAKRFLEKKNMLYKIETVFLHFMQDILKAAKEKEKQKLFLLLKENLTALKKDPLERNAFLHFDYLEWVEGKL